MTTHKLDKKQWRTFFDGISTMLEGKRAEIEVASHDFGVQIEAQWLPVMGVTYDTQQDAFDIALDGLDHVIFHPIELYAEFGLEGIESLAIVEQSAWQIVMLRMPLMLPSPPTPS